MSDDDDILLEDDEDVFELEPDEPTTVTPGTPPVPSMALMQILPADAQLPLLVQFVPDVRLKAALAEVVQLALAVNVVGRAGLQEADEKLAGVRGAMKIVEAHFQDPADIANRLHKSITGVRGEWLADGAAAVKTVGDRVVREKRRLEMVAQDARRQQQAKADAEAREQARQQAKQAAATQAPAAVVEELTRAAETVTAPPVPEAEPITLAHSTVVPTWRTRLVGTPPSDEPQPDIEDLTGEQRMQVFALLMAILEGKAPIAAIEVNWAFLDKRAKSDRSTFSIAGIECFEDTSVRAKGGRGRRTG